MLAWIIVLFVLISVHSSAHAAAGRFVTDGGGTGTAGSTAVNFTITVYVDGTGNTVVSANENVEIRIRNARPGDSCGASSPKTDSSGKLYDNCTATSAGTLTIYAHSNDKGDDGSDFLIYFNNAAPTNTPIPTVVTQAPSATPTPSPSPTLRPTIKVVTEEESPTESPTPEPTEKPTPTPTPETGSFFSNPVNVIGFFIALGVLGVGGYFLWEAEKWPFNPKNKEKITAFFKKTPKNGKVEPDGR